MSNQFVYPAWIMPQVLLFIVVMEEVVKVLRSVSQLIAICRWNCYQCLINK